MSNSPGYQEQQDALFERWKLARPEYDDSPNRHSARDGILDFALWREAKPKILFLLKETWPSPEEWEPSDGIISDANRFSRNVARWRCILQALYRDRSKVPSFADIVLPQNTNDIALVEVKKVNVGQTSSTYKEIIGYAVRDRDFLREQIELIQPEVILCCKTIDAYVELYPEDADEPCQELSCVPVKWNANHCHCYEHHGRLVIDFYHPSIRGGHDEQLLEMLCELLQDGRVFDHFAWGKVN